MQQLQLLVILSKITLQMNNRIILIFAEFPDSNALAPVVQRPDNFIRWIRHYSGSKIDFMFNAVQGFRTLPNLTVVRVCIFACTRGNTEIFSQIETVG